MEKDPVADKLSTSEVLESLLESPLSHQLTETELTDFAKQITKSLNQKE